MPMGSMPSKAKNCWRRSNDWKGWIGDVHPDKAAYFVSSSETQAEIEVTPEMIGAAAEIYDKWEADHCLDDPYGGAAPHAVRELVAAVYRAMRLIEGREAEGK